MSRFITRIRNQVFYGWWIVLLGSLINAVNVGIIYQSFTVFFLPLKRDLELSTTAVSVIYGAGQLEGGIGGPVFGYLMDRFGARRMILIGSSLTGIGLILLSRVNTFLSFLLIYVLIVSVGYNLGSYHPVQAAVNNWFVRRRGTGFAIVSAAGSVGGMVMAPLLSYIILNFGWRPAAVVAGLIILSVSLPAGLGIHRSPEARGLHPDGRPPQEKCPEKVSHENIVDPKINLTVKQTLRTSSYWLLTLSITMRILVTIALSAHLVPILVWKGVNEGTAAYLVGLFAFATIFSMLAMGWIGDRWDKSLLCSVGIIPVILAMIGLLLSQSMIVSYFFVIGMAIIMGTAPVSWSLIGDFFGRSSYATLRGIVTASSSVFIFLSPVFTGWIFDRTKSYTLVLIFFSAVLLSSSCLFVLLSRLRLRQKQTIKYSF